MNAPNSIFRNPIALLQTLQILFFARLMLFLGLAIYASLFLYHGARLAAFPYDVDNSEGFLLSQAMRIAEGGFLYQPLDDPPHMVDNYPPVYPLLSALGIAITGPSFLWPRLLSMLATLATAALLGCWTYLRTHRRDASWLSALIYLSFYHVYSWGALARVDSVGAAFAIAALVWCEWMFNSRRRLLSVAIPLLLLALFTKQSLYAAPLAIFCALFFCVNRTTALLFAGMLSASGIILLGIMALLTEGEAFKHLVVYNVNAFFWSDVWINFRHWIMLYTVWGCAPIAVWLLDHHCHQTSKEPGAPISTPLLYWFCWFALGEALLVGKIGSAPNYFLTLAAASSVGIGLVYGRILAWMDATPSDSRAQAALAFFLATGLFQLGATVHWPHTGMSFAHTPTAAETRAGDYMERELRRLDGPVFSDLCGLALRAGHAPVYDPFICTQLVREGKWDHSEFIQQVRDGRFERILLHFDLFQPDWDRRRFSDELIAAMRERYTLARQAGSYFLYQPNLGNHSVP